MEALEKLGINLPGLVAQIINFALLLVVLYVLAYKRVLKMLDERSARIRESMERAEFVRQEAARTQAEFEARLEAARKEGQAIVAEATKLGERLKEESRQEARRQADALIARAQAEIRSERDEAIAQLRREFADLAILAAGKVIKRSLDREAHKELIEEVLAESKEMGRG